MIINEAERLGAVKEYYFSTKLQEIRNLIAQGIDIINLAIGNPDLSPSPATIAKLQETAANPANHGYQSYRGANELREAISKWYKRIYGVELHSFDEILPLIGSKEGIMHISLAFLNPGDQVLVPNPGYPAYSSASRLVGGEIINYNLKEENDWQPDLDELEGLDLRKVKIMWLNYPNMPTGGRAREITFKKLVTFAARHQILLCHDNPYSLILNSAPPLSLLKTEGAKEVALELNSLSKSHNMAGWRLGWVSGKKDYINTILKVKSNFDSGMFLPTQYAAAEALNNSDSWHQEQNEEYKRRREYVYQILDKLNCKYSKDQEGMFIWAATPADCPDSEVFVEKILQEMRIFISPGFIFGENGRNYVRMSLCNKVERLQESLQRVEKYISSHESKN